MRQIAVFILSFFCLGNVLAQHPCFPVDSIPQYLKSGRDYEAACKGDPKALTQLAFSCRFANMNVSLLCLKNASGQGYSVASLWLANLYCFGFNSIQRDVELAKHYYQLALEQDVTGTAHFAYGYRCANGDLMEADMEQAKYYWLKGGEMGDLDAQCELVRFYYKGEHFEQDYVEAKKWIDKVLEQPDTPSTAYTKSSVRKMLADMYERGLGVEKSASDAFQVYVADSNWVKIAECYETGHGVKSDAKKALLYYEKVLGNHFMETDEACQKAVDYLEKNGNLNSGHIHFILGEYYAGKALQFDSRLAMDYRKQNGEYKSFYGASPLHDKVIENWEISAGTGYTKAISQLVDCYLTGNHVKADTVKATEWLKFGARKTKDKDLLYKMAWHNAKGIGMPVNEAEAVKWYTKAVKAGHYVAATNLGWCYEKGFGCKVNNKKAVKYYRIAAEHGEALALNNLGFAYIRGLGVSVDQEKGIALVQKAIEKGYTTAIPYLRQMLIFGMFDVKPDYEKGAAIFRSLDDSLRHSNYECLASLNTLIAHKPELATDPTEMLRRYTEHIKYINPYFSGSGTETFLVQYKDAIVHCKHTTSKDFLDAMQWMRTENAAGNNKIKAILYDVLNRRPELADNESEAFECLRELAETDDAYYQFQMAWSYAKGLGVQVDSVEAVKWYTKSAANGHSQAAFNLAWCYDFGFGCTKDPQKALGWYEKSAELGNATAVYELGRRYFVGYEVERDVEKAMPYLKKVMSGKGTHAESAALMLAKHYWEPKQYDSLIAMIEGIPNNCTPNIVPLYFYHAMALQEMGKENEALRPLLLGYRNMQILESYEKADASAVPGDNTFIFVIDNIPYVEYVPGAVGNNVDYVLEKFKIQERDFIDMSWSNGRCIIRTKRHLLEDKIGVLVAETSVEKLPEIYKQYAYTLSNIVPEDYICETAYEKALGYDASDLYLLNNYAYKLCLANRELEKALEMSGRTVQAQPNEPYYLDTYACILYMMEKYAEAKVYIDRCLDNTRSTDNNLEVYDHAGEIYAGCGMTDKAKEFWKKAMDCTDDMGIQQLLQQKIDNCNSLK